MTTKTDIIHLADDHEAVLSGRALAAEIRDHIERRIATGQTVVVDFGGITAVSPSFADELFGKLAPASLAGAVRFQGLSVHLESVMQLAVRTRSRAIHEQ